MRVLLVSALLALATPALAASPLAITDPAPATSAVLAEAGSAPGRVIVDGATWRCEGTTCTATGGANQPATRACRRAVARLGKVTAFTWKGTELSAEQLAACNA